MAWLAVAAGTGIWVVWRLGIVLRVVRQSVEAPAAVKDLLESCCCQLGIKRTVRVRCAAIGSPAICGLLRPIILIPPELAENLGGLEMRAVLLHELAHDKRGDLWVNHAQILGQIVYWYNPLLWLANASIRRAREQAVDEMVLVEMGAEAEAYPATLLHVARLSLGQPVAGLGLLGILESGRGLTERILHIMNRPLPRTAQIGGRGLAAVLLLALAALPMACRRNTAAAPQSPASESAQANVGADKDAMILAISKDGAMTLLGNSVTLDNLQEKLVAAARENPPATLTIQAEKGTPQAALTKVLDACQAAHITRINLGAASTTAPPRADWSAYQLRDPGVVRPPGRLEPTEVDALEAKLVQDPEDFSARRDLLLHYTFRDRGASARHVLWIIEHHPEFSASGPEMQIDPNLDQSAYQQGKTLWLQNVANNPTNPVILANAAGFFTVFDTAMAENLLTKAQALDSRNPALSDKLGHVYRLEFDTHPGTNLAAKALAAFERAQAQTLPAVPGAPRLVNLAQMAVAAGDLNKARTYAAEILGPGMERGGGGDAGQAQFYGNTVLGQVALREGKLAEAGKFLVEAGKTKGSPVLDTFGPNMSLAKELLEKGQTNAVLEFFQECEKFWPSHGGENTLARWTAEVKQGKTPDFGATLYY